jgi:DNA-binding NarL/FixJ family response regulator
MKNTVVIVDDHILIAKAISGIMANFKDFKVLYECENGMQLQEKIKNTNQIPNIVLLDISMPIMDGFETANWLKSNHPNVLIMVLSMQDDDQSLIKMISNGAKGYLLKNTHPIELEKALSALIKNGFFYPDWAMSKVFKSLCNNENEENYNAIKISEREKEFLKLATTEMTYKEISQKMFCSPRTIEGYRDSLFEKLDLKTRVGLVVYALKNGFI